MRTISMVRVVGIASALAVASLSARADDCATVISAQFAQAKAPYAATTTMSQPGQPVSRSEMVVSGATMYFQVGGAWQSMPYSAQEVIDRSTENAKKAKVKPTCQKFGAEQVSGEAATVYNVHEEAKDGDAIDSRIWISDSRGLPLKLEVHLGSGTSFTETTRYDGIQPPTGAK
jgi:hypothetical protein